MTGSNKKIPKLPEMFLYKCQDFFSDAQKCLGIIEIFSSTFSKVSRNHWAAQKYQNAKTFQTSGFFQNVSKYFGHH
jgi:hypothetical protein